MLRSQQLGIGILRQLKLLKPFVKMPEDAGCQRIFNKLNKKRNQPAQQRGHLHNNLGFFFNVEISQKRIGQNFGKIMLIGQRQAVQYLPPDVDDFLAHDQLTLLQSQVDPIDRLLD